MNSAIEAFEREFAPWALKLPAADVAARRNGQLRVNGWSVLYEFGSDTYGEYLDYYAALRGATDARVNDDWHARIYETGQVVAFPAVLEAYLYGRDPSQEELDRAREPVLASLAPAETPPDADIGSADTALWADLRDVVEAQVAPPQKVEPPKAEPPKVEAPKADPPSVEPSSVEPPKVAPPRRPSAETPAEIDSLLDAAFSEAPEPVAAAQPAVEKPVAEEAEKEPEKEPEAQDQPPAPRRSVPGYDPFVEFRTLEPKSARKPAPTGDDFRPYWQRYPARAAGIGAAIAAVLLIGFALLGHGGSKQTKTKTVAAADTTAGQPAADTTTPTAPPQPDTQPLATPDDTASTPAPAPQPAPPPAPSSGESTVARPVGPGSISPIVRAHPGS